MKRLLIVCLATVCLSGCATSSLPITHLQLAAGERRISEHDTPLIELDAVAMPDFLLRRDLLRRKSDYELHYDSGLRWAEPLDLAVQRVLEQRLKSLLDTDQIYSFPLPPPRSPDWQLKVSITHFEAQENAVVLSAEGRWEQHRSAGVAVEKVLFEESIDLVAGSGEEIAAAMSELLWRFSDTLAEVLLPIERSQGRAIDTEIITQ